MTKIHLVVDSWQYDGGVDIDSVWSDPEDAVKRREEMRNHLADLNQIYKENYGDSQPFHSEARVNAIFVLTKEIK